MKSIRFTLNSSHQVSYDTDRNLFLIGSASIKAGELEMGFTDCSRRFFMRALLIWAVKLYKADAGAADELFRAAIDIALACGEPLPDEWVSRLIEARNAYLVRNSSR